MELKNQKYQTLKFIAPKECTFIYNQSIPWYKQFVQKLKKKSISIFKFWSNLKYSTVPKPPSIKIKIKTTKNKYKKKKEYSFFLINLNVRK